MSTTVTLNGTNYEVPDTSEDNWGQEVTDYLVALGSGVLQKSGGAFTLTAEVDFGLNHGVKSVYFKSRGTTSATGIFRLANNENVSWRDQGNTADLALKVNTSNALEFNGNPITVLALGAAHTVMKMNAAGTAFEYGLLTDSNIAAGANINANKLGTGAISNTVFNYLTGVSSNIQTQFGTKFNNSDVIDEDDMVSNDDTKVPTQQSTKTYVDTEVATKLSPVTTTEGDLIVGNGAGNEIRLPKGASGQVLTAGASTIAWQTLAGSGDVTAASNIADNALVKGDGGAKGIQQSGILVNDNDYISGFELAGYNTLIDSDNTILSGTTAFHPGPTVDTGNTLTIAAGATLITFDGVVNGTIINNGTHIVK
jgi:hypothetical protein